MSSRSWSLPAYGGTVWRDSGARKLFAIADDADFDKRESIPVGCSQNSEEGISE